MRQVFVAKATEASVFVRYPQVDPTEQRLAKWTRCQLSGEDLAPPCVADELGHLFNKDAVVNGASCSTFALRTAWIGADGTVAAYFGTQRYGPVVMLAVW